MEVKTKTLEAVSSQELLRRLEWIGEDKNMKEQYRLIVEELQKRGIPAEIPLDL